jgi:hypothetical protein
MDHFCLKEASMKSTDKVLIGIVSGIILLVVVAFSVALLRPEPAYLPDDTPEGVAFNYLFALQQGDYERAYHYLSPTINGYPRGYEAFADDIRANSWSFDRLTKASVAVEVGSSSVEAQRADVEIKETRFYESGLFNSRESTRYFTVRLIRRSDKTWKIENSEQYWLWCWNRVEGCK